jgi:two-component system, chemotaxis family, protein-glutamate methylesterase/glutaminase
VTRTVLRSPAPRRVLICEDSPTYAAGLRRMLEYDGDIAVAAIVGTAEEAITALPRIKPDLVTMDIALPGMDGIAAVERIMSSAPVPILVLSGLVGHGTDKSAAALAAGALEAVAKDDLDLREPGRAVGAAFRRRIRALSHARVIKHPRGRLRDSPDGRGHIRHAAVIGICSSTGGPQVLARLLEMLPADYPIPVLVVQHIAAGFTRGLVNWLDETIPLPVDIATHLAPARPGAHFAPEDAHLKLTPAGRLSLDRETVAGGYRPSGDVLLESIAASAGRLGVAVVLTGMGADGAAGAAAVQSMGGLAIAQDEATSAIYGMPKVAADLGVELTLPPADIGARLLSLAHEPLPGAR